jgi:hypothetical protein
VIGVPLRQIHGEVASSERREGDRSSNHAAVERPPRARDDAGHAEHEQLHADDGEYGQGNPKERVAPAPRRGGEVDAQGEERAAGSEQQEGEQELPHGPGDAGAERGTRPLSAAAEPKRSGDSVGDEG